VLFVDCLRDVTFKNALLQLQLVRGPGKQELFEFLAWEGSPEVKGGPVGRAF